MFSKGFDRFCHRGPTSWRTRRGVFKDSDADCPSVGKRANFLLISSQIAWKLVAERFFDPLNYPLGQNYVRYTDMQNSSSVLLFCL